MVHGPLAKNVLRFAVPLMLTSVLQLLFNAADLIVVSNFAGANAMGSVGATGSLINLIINVVMGMSIGTSVLVAKHWGAREGEDVSKVVHTSVTFSVVGGIVIGIIGIFISRPMLQLMDTPPEIIDGSTTYMRIYFAGFPIIALYNFGAAVLRSTGDTKHPLYFLMIAGVINVLLNLLFVIVFHMGVAGVAIPTVISQAISAFLVLRCMVKSNTAIHFDIRKAKMDWGKLKEMMKIGLPAGIQGSIFSISNVVIQSSINYFGAVAVSGSAASANLEGFVYVIMSAFYQTSLTFTGQNVGAKNYSRIMKVMVTTVSMVAAFGLVFGVGVYLAGGTLLKIYTQDPEVIKYAIERLLYLSAPYFICGIMDTMVGMMRGLGYSITPMIVSLTGVVGIRLGWIFTIFAANKTLPTLFISYPISWTVTALTHIGCFIYAYRKLMKKVNSEEHNLTV